MEDPIGSVADPMRLSYGSQYAYQTMGTMFPENGGYVVWVSSALGPFWGFQQGWAKWLSGVIDNALYPVFFLDYVKSSVLALGGGLPRTFAVLILTVMVFNFCFRKISAPTEITEIQ